MEIGERPHGYGSGRLGVLLWKCKHEIFWWGRTTQTHSKDPHQHPEGLLDQVHHSRIGEPSTLAHGS